MFAVCPVCIERSFLWCRGSHTMVCWSSEPEANKLKGTGDKHAPWILLFHTVPGSVELFDHRHPPSSSSPNQPISSLPSALCCCCSLCTQSLQPGPRAKADKQQFHGKHSWLKHLSQIPMGKQESLVKTKMQGLHLPYSPGCVDCSTPPLKPSQGIQSQLQMCPGSPRAHGVNHKLLLKSLQGALGLVHPSASEPKESDICNSQLF